MSSNNLGNFETCEWLHWFDTMKKNMADAVAQREARRRKILQNQEERMNRLLGKYAEGETVKQSTPEKVQQNGDLEALSPHQSLYNLRQRPQKNSNILPKSPISLLNQYSVQPDLVESNSTTVSKETCIPSKEHETDEVSIKEIKSGSTIGHIGDSVPTEHSPMPAETNTNVNSLPFDLQRLDAQTLDILKIVMFVLAALFQRYLLKFGFGICIFPSIFLPFIALELTIKYSVHTYLKHIPFSNGRGNLMSAALMLCGIRQDIMDTYHLIMAHVASAASDFSVYFFAFIIGDAWMT